MRLALFALVAGCAYHRPVGHRIESDGDLPVDVIRDAPEGVPVSATVTVRDGRMSSTASVHVVGPSIPAYMSGMDPALQQAVSYSAVYRQQWAAQNGTIPGARLQVVYVSPGTVKCPATLAEIDTLEERVSCLEDDVDYRVGELGVK